eukprot:EG_transcript_8578
MRLLTLMRSWRTSPTGCTLWSTTSAARGAATTRRRACSSPLTPPPLGSTSMTPTCSLYLFCLCMAAPRTFSFTRGSPLRNVGDADQVPQHSAEIQRSLMAASCSGTVCL